MSRWLALVALILVLPSCATGEDDVAGTNFGKDSGGSGTETGGDGATGEGGADSTTPIDGGSDSGVDSTSVDSGASDTAVVDSTVADTSVADTFVADTYVADTFVADTYVPDTFIADTFVPDTYVPDTYVADTFVPDTGGPCSATIVDWNWNTGTGPTTLVKSGTASAGWAIGKATGGPADGLNWLATAPGSSYPNLANDWVRLPTISLAGYTTCKIKVTVDLWRSSEKYGLVYYDGGNLQYTTDPAASTGWTLMDGGGMGYDSTLSCSSCIMAGQKTWTSSSTPYAKTGTFTSPAALGANLTVRFTFYSDDSNTLGPLPGLYIKRLRVDAVP